MTAVSPSAHPASADGTAPQLVTVRVAALRADEQRRGAHRPDGHPDPSREHARRPQPHLVCLGPSAADADGHAFLGRTVAVHRQHVRRRTMHRTGRAAVRTSRLVPVAEQVLALARADVDQGVGPEAERGLQPLQHVIRPLAERHPRRELGLPRLEHSCGPRLRHARDAERKPKLVSFLGGQLASRRDRSDWLRSRSNPRTQCRGSSAAARAPCDECEPLERVAGDLSSDACALLEDTESGAGASNPSIAENG